MLLFLTQMKEAVELFAMGKFQSRDRDAFIFNSTLRKPYHTCLKRARFCERGILVRPTVSTFFHDTHKGTVHKGPTPFCEGPRFFGHLSLTGAIQIVYHKFRILSRVVIHFRRHRVVLAKPL